MTINELTVETAERYRDAFFMTKKDKDGDLPPLTVTSPQIYEGENRLEFLGMMKHHAYSKTNPNGYYLYWRVLPQPGQPCELHHYVLHNFSLPQVAGGLNKISAFNDAASKETAKFLKENRAAL